MIESSFVHDHKKRCPGQPAHPEMSPADGPTNENKIPSLQRKGGRECCRGMSAVASKDYNMNDNMIVGGDAIRLRVEAAKKQVELSKSLLLSSNGTVELIRTCLADARKAQEAAGTQLTASREEVQLATGHLQTSEGCLDSSMTQELVNGGDGVAANQVDAVRRRAKAARIQVKLSQSAVLASCSMVDEIEKSLAIAERDQKVASIKFKMSQLELYHAENSLKMAEKEDHVITSKLPGTFVGNPTMFEKAAKTRRSIIDASMNKQQGLDNCGSSMSAPSASGSLHFKVHGDAGEISIGAPSRTSWQNSSRCVKPNALHPSRNLVISPVVHPKPTKVEQRAGGSATVRPRKEAVPIVRLTPTIVRPKALRVRGVGMTPPGLPPDNLSLTDISFIEDWIRNPDSSLFLPVDDSHHPCKSEDVPGHYKLGTGPVPI